MTKGYFRKDIYSILNSSKKRTKKFVFRSNCFRFFGRIEDTKRTFRNQLSFSYDSQSVTIWTSIRTIAQCQNISITLINLMKNSSMGTSFARCLSFRSSWLMRNDGRTYLGTFVQVQTTKLRSPTLIFLALATAYCPPLRPYIDR